MMAYPVTLSILCLRPPQLRQAYPILPYLPAYFHLHTMSFNDLERGYGPSNSGRGSRARTGPIAIGNSTIQNIQSNSTEKY